jgi:hypothetical protein
MVASAAGKRRPAIGAVAPGHARAYCWAIRTLRGSAKQGGVMTGNNNLQRYQDLVDAVNAHPDWKRVMCFGDSWFQYPIAPGKDIQKVLPRIYRRTLFFNEGVAGLDSAKYKMGRGRVTRNLGEFEFDVLLLSMGGNDIAGSEMVEFVKEKDAPQDVGTRQWGVIPAPVRDHVRLSAFQRTLEYIQDDIFDMVQRRNQVRGACEIVMHTYDYPWPDGKPFKLGPIKAGPWIKPHLDDVGLTDFDQQRTVVMWLLDQYAALLNQIASQTPRFRVVKSLGTLKRAQWGNEMHPTKAGFKVLVEKCWVPVLADIL